MIDIRIAEKKTLRTGLLGNRKRISILLGVLLFLLFDTGIRVCMVHRN